MGSFDLRRTQDPVDRQSGYATVAIVVGIPGCMADPLLFVDAEARDKKKKEDLQSRTERRHPHRIRRLPAAVN
jgi:hypothetical protein